MENIISGQSFEGNMPTSEFENRRNKAIRAFREFLDALGYDYENDPNMRETPERVTKMYMTEICTGTYQECPRMKSFENTSEYDGIVFQGQIEVKSLCSHHFGIIRGFAHVAYIPGDKVIGLSKLNRVVEWFSRRPQLQEQMTKQIHDFLDEMLEGNGGVAVQIEANHSCCSHRGVNQDSTMKTIFLSGAFKDKSDTAKSEFLHCIETMK